MLFTWQLMPICMHVCTLSHPLQQTLCETNCCHGDTAIFFFLLLCVFKYICHRCFAKVTQPLKGMDCCAYKEMRCIAKVKHELWSHLLTGLAVCCLTLQSEHSRRSHVGGKGTASVTCTNRKGYCEPARALTWRLPFCSQALWSEHLPLPLQQVQQWNPCVKTLGSYTEAPQSVVPTAHIVFQGLSGGACPLS